MARIERVLIANRGEIARRIADSAAALGIESVTVHVDADERALHTTAGDRSERLSAPPHDPVRGYLDIEQLIAVARRAACDAVHPGYGFLSESAAFARACGEAGLTFVGPDAECLDLFGDKPRSRDLARACGVPIVDGEHGIDDVSHARDAAARIGLPVMLKAAAGGGGRGMRRVDEIDDIEDAFDRCRSEAAAAFGDGRIYVEKLIERPRHIEVQVLADRFGDVIVLGDRDCSIQLRNQKVVEIAPAIGIDESVRRRLHESALRLTREAGLVNAATVEFLVSAEDGDIAFIECNPRIQVEHTVTEEITGIDLIAAQFRIAGGERLGALDLDGSPIGFAVEARVVATGTGTITSYREPAGRNVRVDGAAYAGDVRHAWFDPLIAKVITSSRDSIEDAVGRCRRAVERFHIDGVPTNLGSLIAILAHPDVVTGDARTTLLAENPALLDAAPPVRHDSTILDRAAHSATPADLSGAPELEVHPGALAVCAPGESTVVEISVTVGDIVSVGQPIAVTTAMKMETVIVASADGRVTALAELAAGSPVRAGQTIAVIDPLAETGGEAGAARRESVAPWSETLDEMSTLRALAAERLAPGSDDPGVVRQRSRGKLTCRERIDLLLDDGTFREVGSAAGFATYGEDGGIVAFTPANSVGGTGNASGRPVVVCADDFTSRGGHSDGAIAAKSFFLDQLSVQLRVPSIRLLDGSSGGGSVASMVPEQRRDGESTAKESTGAIEAGRPRVAGGGGSFLPGHLGSTEYAEQLASVPVVNVLLGSVVGLGAAKAVLGHFSVMVRDIAQLFVAGPPVVSHAMGVDVTKEALGGWHLHCRNGSVDNLAESEEDAMEMTRRFLSYLPSSVHEAPPRAAVGADDARDRVDEELAWIIPRKRTTTFDVRRVIELVADRESFFEIGPLWGTDQVTGLARVDGHTVGVIASDSRHLNGGALTADGCDKLTRLLDLCDLFHIPVLNLVDNPGFAVGIEHEEAGTIRRGGAWMVAFAQTSVPIYTVIMRRSFGVAGNNYATPRREVSARVVWPAADTGGIPPEGGIEAAYKRQLAEAEDPAALRAELEARIESARGPLGPLSRFQIEEMVDPRDTRRLLCEWLDVAVPVATAADRLGARPLGFRP